MKIAVLVVVGLLIAAAIAWDAAERHYTACVNTAKATTAGQIWGPSTLPQRIRGCSRLP